MPQWTEELKQRRRNTAIRNLMEDKQLTIEEATEEYYARYRRNGAKGGKNSRGSNTGFALMDEKRRKEVSKKGVEARGK